jgi:3-oxoacyl-ACP reductase-like protein
MSVFGKIMSAIFGSHATAAPATPASAPAAPSAPAAARPSSAAPATPVDVEAVLTKLAAQNKEKLDWRKSIVDLMKLLNLDSSLAARKELAEELHYGGDKNDSATMNIWLHKQVMQKLAENGGKVPEDLRK